MLALSTMDRPEIHAAAPPGRACGAPVSPAAIDPKKALAVAAVHG
jgi:hypothetical protein